MLLEILFTKSQNLFISVVGIDQTGMEMQRFVLTSICDMFCEKGSSQTVELQITLNI